MPDKNTDIDKRLDELYEEVNLENQALKKLLENLNYSIEDSFDNQEKSTKTYYTKRIKK